MPPPENAFPFWMISTGRYLPLPACRFSILDLACAMHPFAHPWMNLPPDCPYLAYDLHQPRVDLINHFFQTAGINGQAFYG